MYENSGIPVGEVGRFIAAKGPKPCAGCGGTNFDSFDEARQGHRVSYVAFPFPDYDITKAKSIDIIYAACSNCGLTRTYSRPIVVSWLNANPK